MSGVGTPARLNSANPEEGESQNALDCLSASTPRHPDPTTPWGGGWGIWEKCLGIRQRTSGAECARSTENPSWALFWPRFTLLKIQHAVKHSLNCRPFPGLQNWGNFLNNPNLFLLCFCSLLFSLVDFTKISIGCEFVYTQYGDL